MTEQIVLLVVLPMAGAVFALAAKVPRISRHPRTARILIACAIAPLVVGGFILAATYPIVRNGAVIQYAIGGWRVPLGISLELSGLGWISSVLVYLLSFLIALFAYTHREYGSEFYVFYLLMVAGMEGVVLTIDLFNMFVSFELVAISAYVLIAYHRNDRALVASFKYLILSSVGILFFLFGVLAFYRELGTLSLHEIGELSAEVGSPARLRVLRLATAALVVGVGVRSAFIPFHTWLPEAHAFAPHPVSALLSGVLIKVSFLAMVRIGRAFGGELLSPLFMWLGAVTALVAVVWALSQRDAKRLLAYHSISQMGYILAAFGAGGALAMTAAVYHTISHAMFKSLLFLVVGSVIHLSGERDLYRMSGRGARTLLAPLFFVGALSIVGVPGFNGFASKQAISSALSGSLAYPLIWLASIGTAASFIKLSRVFWGRQPEPENGDNKAVSAPQRRTLRWSAIPMGVLAALCIATGIAPNGSISLLQQLLAPWGSGITLSSPFAPAKLAGTLLVVVLGLGVYLLSRLAPGRRLAARIEATAPNLHSVLLMFIAGVVGIALFAVAA